MGAVSRSRGPGGAAIGHLAPRAGVRNSGASAWSVKGWEARAGDPGDDGPSRHGGTDGERAGSRATAAMRCAYRFAVAWWARSLHVPSTRAHTPSERLANFFRIPPAVMSTHISPITTAVSPATVTYSMR